jgi:hypothetical protein
MLIEQIDVIGSQTLERGLRDGSDMLRTTIRTAPALTGGEVDVKAESGGDDDGSDPLVELGARLDKDRGAP